MEYKNPNKLDALLYFESISLIDALNELDELKEIFWKKYKEQSQINYEKTGRYRPVILNGES